MLPMVTSSLLIAGVPGRGGQAETAGGLVACLALVLFTMECTALFGIVQHMVRLLLCTSVLPGQSEHCSTNLQFPTDHDILFSDAVMSRECH